MKKLAWAVTILLLLYLVAMPVVSIVRSLYIGIPSGDALFGGEAFMTLPLYKESIVLFLVMILGILVEFFIRKRKGYFKELEVEAKHDPEEQ